MFKKSFFILLIISSFTLQAQKKNNVKVGINTGLNYTNIWGSYYANDSHPQVGYVLGVGFDISLSNNFSFITNFNYERKSFYVNEAPVFSGFTGSSWPSDIKSVTKFDYLTVPLLLKFKFDGEYSPFINAGPFISVPLNVTNYYDGTKNNLDFNKLFGGNNMGISLGIGYEFELSKTNSLSLELRDDFGLTEVNNASSYSLNDTRMNTASFIAKWNFKI
ncbi:PorT family protein [Flavobacterium sp. SM15]|uniref:porin family protein n=1 Tax=Flavobacterium sp. SM15 TaxID=2908005 RepID=UPI001EDB1B42|nr:porin family protein [Flavobacterium sp. SM15]MCG2612082.1 PorT family protein [Flavobacterium sp. SM15]